MALSEIDGVIELDDEAQEDAPINAMESYLDFSSIESFNSIEEEEKEIKEIEKIQQLEKMYQFVNTDITYEQLNEYANKCLSYATSDDREFSRIITRAGGLKSKNIVIESDDDDFI